MYFFCPNCATVLRVDSKKIPSQRVRYTCKGCGTTSVVQDHLRDSLPSANGFDAPSPLAHGGTLEPAGDAYQADGVGTIYHHVSGMDRADLPPAVYEICCAVKGQDGNVRKLTFTKDCVVVGRSGADLRVNDPLVSRAHAQIERVKDQILVKDLGSTNGTFVNDESAAVRVLEEDDVVRVGNTFIRVALTVRSGEA